MGKWTVDIIVEPVVISIGVFYNLDVWVLKKITMSKNSNLVVGGLLILVSCSPMTPTEMDKNLPTLTKSKYLTQAQAEEAVKTNKCMYLVKGREYAAYPGLTAKGDLKNGATGIDDWVKLDGGNAYVLISYKWVTISDQGSTQLEMKFDTMVCE